MWNGIPSFVRLKREGSLYAGTTATQINCFIFHNFNIHSHTKENSNIITLTLKSILHPSKHFYIRPFWRYYFLFFFFCLFVIFCLCGFFVWLLGLVLSEWFLWRGWSKHVVIKIILKKLYNKPRLSFIFAYLFHLLPNTLTFI